MAADDDARIARAHNVLVRLVLPPYTIHFKSPSYMKEATLDLLDKKVCKDTLRSTAEQALVREAIGTDARFWTELDTLLKAALPSLERRSFAIWDPSSVDYESTSGALIASHYPGLWRDLERLNDLISISRNILTVGAPVQNLAAADTLDTEIFRLINCCVRVTARGYDGDAGTEEEERWQWIVNAYKKLLITSLQFLNNLVAQNERRKLMLWLSLFDNTAEAALTAEDIPETSTGSLTDVPSNPTSAPLPPLDADDILLAYGTNGVETLDLTNAQSLWDDMPWSHYPPPIEVLKGRETMTGNGYALFVKRLTECCKRDWNIERQRDPTDAEVYTDMPRRWEELLPSDRDYWQQMYDDALARYHQDLAVYEAKMLALLEEQSEPQTAEQVNNQINHAATKATNTDVLGLPGYSSDGQLSFDHQNLQSHTVVADDMRMLFTADAGAKILQSGKAELMKRLEGYEAPLAPNPPQVPTRRLSSDVLQSHAQTSMPPMQPTQSIERSSSRSPQPVPHPPNNVTIHQDDPTVIEDSIVDEEEEEEDDEADEEESEDEGEEDEEDYPGSTEDGRGLLTDVPLILGPSEIEVLPMLIMSGIVPPHNLRPDLSAKEKNAIMNMHTVRTHILLSQSNGRNLLRELLIFVAAWDLREEELYFKFMVKILEAILMNGLMPYAYHAFRDRSRSKDIISPAQAVIMKLLTSIFRSKGEAAKAAAANKMQVKLAAVNHPVDFPTAQTPTSWSNGPSRVELHILNYIFTEFRQHIIPQTCALIFLQGQIHAGRASPEDFPLNLWDMERMYEGVYQYLEFFAVLTEEGVWKGILGEWEMASELVTLLRELEGGIPKLGPMAPPPPPPPVPSNAPAAAERPFDVDANGQPMKLPSLNVPLTSSGQPAFEPETPLAYPEDSAAPPGRDFQHDQDEPSDFEWRNLKKLTVLVLSSLIWKNRKVQDQVRYYGGLEALVGCCRADDHNPYIREHAIMCLRFAVEGCEENAQVIRKMANAQGHKAIEGVHSSQNAIEDVPREVLDTNGYETFMDIEGQVGLRRKEVGHGSSQQAGNMSSLPSTSSGTGAGVSKPPRFLTTKMTADKAAELMQNALKDLPITTRAITDKQKAEALAKLDQAFESTEQLINRAKKG